MASTAPETEATPSPAGGTKAGAVIDAACAVLLGTLYVVRVSRFCVLLAARARVMGAGGVVYIWDGIPEVAFGLLPWLKWIARWIIPTALAGYLVAGLVRPRQKPLALLPLAGAAAWGAVCVLSRPRAFLPPAWPTIIVWLLALGSTWGGASARGWRRGSPTSEQWHSLAQWVVVSSLLCLFVAQPDSSYGVKHVWMVRLPSVPGLTPMGVGSSLWGLPFDGRVVAFFVFSFGVVGAAVGALGGRRACAAAPAGVLLAGKLDSMWNGGWFGMVWWQLAMTALALAGALIGAGLAGALVPWVWRSRVGLRQRLPEGWIRFRRLDIDY